MDRLELSAVKLFDLDGRPTTLAEIVVRPTLLVFLRHLA
jgi:hypothetical protein